MVKSRLLKKYTHGLLSVIGVFICLASLKAQVSSGTLVQIQPFPSEWIAERTIYVWLPEGYTPQQKYQVLYMHDGQMLFDSLHTWNHQEWQVDETMTQLLAKHAVPNTIVVGIQSISALRHSEYFPQKPFEEFLNPSQQDSIYQAVRNSEYPLFNAPIQSDAYLQFIVKELKPYIDTYYSTYTDASHTFIGGSSMGGLISMYALCEYPDIFGGAFCMSTHWPGIFESDNNPIPEAFFSYLKQKLPLLQNHKLYFDYGNRTLDALYPPYQQKVDALLQNPSYANLQWKTEFFEGADHSEKSWAQRLAIPLVYMLNP